MPRLKKSEKEKRNSRTLRFTDAEWKSFQEHADLYTEGNITEWLSYAGTTCKPNPKDLIPSSPEPQANKKAQRKR